MPRPRGQVHRPETSLLIRLGALAALVALVAMAGPAGPPSAQAAPPRVKSVSLDNAQDRLIVNVDLTARLEPRVFAIGRTTDNPRVVIDFMGAAGRKLPSRLDSPSPLAHRVRIGRHPDKIRLVVDLVPGRLYRVEQMFRRDINRYVLTLSAEKD